MADDCMQKRKCNLCDGTVKSCWRCGGKGWYYVWPDGTPYVYTDGYSLYTQGPARDVFSQNENQRLWM